MLLAWLTIAIVATAIVVAVLMTVALTVLALLLFLALLTVLLRSGAPKVAPTAAGSPNPIVPSPPLVTTERFLLYLK